MKILVTGATDGIGLATARKLVEKGHHVLLHGRNKDKVASVANELGEENVESYVADFSQLAQVSRFAQDVLEKHDHLDVLINNAGVYSSSNVMTDDGLDLRFAVNTVAPYLLTKSLLPLMDLSSRIVNLSSAAQSPVDVQAFIGNKVLSDGEAYAQSKLALTMWSNELAKHVDPVVVAVNPKSLLGSKMVKNAYGVDGHDISIGADILCRATLSDEFANASGKYFDNDIEEFSEPHPDARDREKCGAIVKQLNAMIGPYL